MATTPVYAFPYQSLSDPPHGPDLGQDLAERVETVLQGALSLGGALTVPGNLTVGGNLDVTGVGRLIPAYKTATTSRNSGGTGTTLTADPHLTASVVANGVYLTELSIAWNAHATPDIKWDFTVPSGATFDKYRQVIQGTSAAWTAIGATASTVQTLSANGADQVLLITGTLVVGANAGSLTLRWAQNTSDANNTTVYAGSWMRLHRIA